MLRQLLAATLCAVLALSACSSAAPLSSSTPSHIYDAETLSKTRVWGSNQKNLLHVRAVLLVSEKQHWGYEKCRWENVVGSVVTYDAFGKLLHQTGTTPNNYLFAGEQFDPDLGMYYNRARYLNTSTSRFWSMDDHAVNPTDPQTLHRYLYVQNDPINKFDPTGNDSVEEEIGAAEDIEIAAQNANAVQQVLNGIERASQATDEFAADSSPGVATFIAALIRCVRRQRRTFCSDVNASAALLGN